jgi:hypothetical protein
MTADAVATRGKEHLLQNFEYGNFHAPPCWCFLRIADACSAGIIVETSAAARLSTLMVMSVMK